MIQVKPLQHGDARNGSAIYQDWSITLGVQLPTHIPLNSKTLQNCIYLLHYFKGILFFYGAENALKCPYISFSFNGTFFLTSFT
jgi:hypothetical protein